MEVDSPLDVADQNQGGLITTATKSFTVDYPISFSLTARACVNSNHIANPTVGYLTGGTANFTSSLTVTPGSGSTIPNPETVSWFAIGK